MGRQVGFLRVCIMVLGVLATGGSAFGHDSVEPSVNVLLRQDKARFQKAHGLIQERKFEPALELLQENIKETPDAGNIDYSYGWACYCAAQLGKVDLTLEYYEVMSTRFHRHLSLGDDGVHRNWDSRLWRARKAIEASKSPRKDEALRKMDELDVLGFKAAVARVKDLVRKTQQGDQIARRHLMRSGNAKILVNLIASGELELSEADE